MDGDSFRALFEINPVILGPVAVKFFPFPLDDPKPAGVEIIEVLRENLEFGQQLQLERFRQGRHFRGA